MVHGGRGVVNESVNGLILHFDVAGGGFPYIVKINNRSHRLFPAPSKLVVGIY